LRVLVRLNTPFARDLQFPSADIDNRMFALTQNEEHGNANYNKLIQVSEAFAVTENHRVFRLTINLSGR